MLRRLGGTPAPEGGAAARAGGDASRPPERRAPPVEGRGNRCFVLSALSVCVVVLLVWNVVLVSAINRQPFGVSAAAARRVAAGSANALPSVAAAPAAQVQPTVTASEDLALVANEVIALRTWASNIVDSNKRLASAYGSIELPASATAAERASFEALSVEVSAAMAQSVAVGAAVEETVRKPLALLPTPSPRIWCLVPVVWPRDNALIDVLRKTWGVHCDVLKFAVDRRDYAKHNLAARTDLAAHFMPLDLKHAVKPNVDHGWEKVWRMWAEVGAKHAGEGDFFLKANTGTFVAVDNLRAFLRYYDAEQKHYLGHTILSKWRADNVKYNAAAGYVLSRASLVALAPKLAQLKAGGNARRDCTDHAGESEDVSLSICLRALGILPGDTLDSRGRQRFMMHPADTELSLFRRTEDLYWSHKPANVGEGAHCCSKFPILFDGHWGGKYRGDEYRRRFEELDYILFDAVGGVHAHRDVEPPSLGLFRYDADSLTFVINEARDSCRVVDCKAPPPAPIVNARYSPPPKLDHLRFFGTATLLDDGSEGGAGGGGGASVAGLERTGRPAMEPLRDDERFLSFEYYPGRLNNQLWTLDWAFRCAKAMGRTLYISRPTQQVQYVGLPDRRDDEVGDAPRAVLWDMKRLRSAFRFVLQHELDGSPALSGASATLLSSNPDSLNADCVWKDGADVFIAQWMAAPQRNGTGKCRRLHLMTNHGMVHAWRTATRKWGVGPFVFFNAMRPAQCVLCSRGAPRLIVFSQHPALFFCAKGAHLISLSLSLSLVLLRNQVSTQRGKEVDCGRKRGAHNLRALARLQRVQGSHSGGSTVRNVPAPFDDDREQSDRASERG